DRPAVAWNGREWTYAAFAKMVTRLARFLSSQGVAAGDVVLVMAANRPEMLAAHYAVPMLGAVLNTVNTRLDVDTVEYILLHAESRVVIADAACASTACPAARKAKVPLYQLCGGVEDGAPVDGAT